MSEELDAKKRHLESLEMFLKSPAHKGFVAAMNYDIAATRDAIIAVDPRNREDEIECFKLRGELRALEARVTMFEDARVTLKDRIDELVERDIQNATTTKK